MSRDGSLAEITVLRGATHILDSLRSIFAVYVCSNRLKSVPRLDPCTDIDGRILLTTTVKDPHTVDKLLAACQISLDPTEYQLYLPALLGFFASRTVTCWNLM